MSPLLTGSARTKVFMVVTPELLPGLVAKGDRLMCKSIEKPNDILYSFHLTLRRDGKGYVSIFAGGDQQEFDIKNVPRSIATNISDTILGLATD